MRPRVRWMKGPDDQILETLAETDMALTPKVLSFEVDYQYTYIKDRLRELLDRGLVTTPDQAPTGVQTSGVYRITDLGRAYLAGDLTADEMNAL